MGKNRVLQRANAKRRIEEEPTIKYPKGCPCPGLKGCLIGEPVSPREESIVMLCSATPCPFEEIPIHKPCFEKYEDQLIKTLMEKGSARGWTEYKARRNLWKPCGQGLIGMYCRCICTKGNVLPTEEIINSERILVTPSERDKKKKKKDLPVINMNGGANAKQARMQARFEREEMIEDERNLGREFYTPPITPRRTRNSSVTSYSSQSIISTSSNTRTAVSSPFAQGEDPIHRRSRNMHGRRGGRKRDESRARLDSGVSVKTPLASPVRECATPLMPAVTPPPMTRSYAATIVNHLPKISQSSDDISIDNTIIPSNSSPPSTSNHRKVGEPTLMCETWYTTRSIEWEIATRGHYDPDILLSHERPASYFLPSPCFDHIKIPSWDPWKGKDFDLGPFSIAGVAIPMKKDIK